MSYQNLLKLIEVLGVLAFAMTGIFEARRLKMDIVGTYSVAMITAFGGGTMRDLFLQRHPLFWIQEWPYGVVILVLSVISVAILRQIKDRKSKVLIIVVTVCDALGLGLFSILGALYSLQVYPSLSFIAVIMGVITGSFGGVIRDIITNKVPTMFQKSQLYATC
ncbi:MAG TPA: trimeric intracellular cation channel family protein, partial [Spirochaetia bacterium]|nr:trimeric intracellular cation channel family protein [Spirochaetia bacterium]